MLLLRAVCAATTCTPTPLLVAFIEAISANFWTYGMRCWRGFGVVSETLAGPGVCVVLSGLHVMV